MQTVVRLCGKEIALQKPYCCSWKSLNGSPQSLPQVSVREANAALKTDQVVRAVSLLILSIKTSPISVFTLRCSLAIIYVCEDVHVYE